MFNGGKALAKRKGKGEIVVLVTRPVSIFPFFCPPKVGTADRGVGGGGREVGGKGGVSCRVKEKLG